MSRDYATVTIPLIAGDYAKVGGSLDQTSSTLLLHHHHHLLSSQLLSSIGSIIIDILTETT